MNNKEYTIWAHNGYQGRFIALEVSTNKAHAEKRLAEIQQERGYFRMKLTSRKV